ncbi:MAG: cyclic peptide export ABC transporter [Lysobacter sp.]|nr:cyclic peptide export ABC transporter [Lysobacter sp.]
MIGETLRRHRGLLAVSIVLLGVSAVTSLLLLTLIGGIASGAPSQRVLAQAVGCLVAMLLSGGLAQICQAQLSAELTSDLRSRLAGGFLAVDYEQLMRSRESVAGALIVDVSRLTQMLLLFPQVFFNALLVLLCVGYLASLSLPLLAVFLSFLLVTVAGAMLVMHRSQRIFERIRRDEGRLFEHFRMIADAKKEMTLNAARAAHFSERVLGEAIRANGQNLRQAHRMWGFGETWNNALVYAAILVVAYAGRVSFGEDTTLVVRFVVTALFLIGPVGSLMASTRHVVSGLGSLRHLRALGTAFSATSPALPRADPTRFRDWRRIELRAVEYRYRGENEDEEFSLGPIDLTLDRGELVFVVGGNGSGKSTLALLLSGILIPSAGEISIDGQRLGADALSDYQQVVTAIFADYRLFEHVIDRRGEAPAQTAVDALLHRLGLQDKVGVVDGRFSTLDLSQGQKKRLALAQGRIEDSQIYVLDEWAADQDAEFRRHFYLELLPELKAAGKTLVVITHDDRYFDVAERLIKLEYGRIAAVQTPRGSADATERMLTP